MGKVSLSEFEYYNIIKKVNYYCDDNNIKNKSFNIDFIITDAIERYIRCKENADYLTNEKIICATIKTISKRSVLNYIFKNNVNYNNVRIDENLVGIEIENKILTDKAFKLLYEMFSSLPEKEQALFELLSEKDVSKNEACKLLNIDTCQYNNFISKMKLIINKLL